MKPYEAVHHVQEKHRGIAVKLSAITGKCEELFRSHGRESKTVNPIASGNLSPVDAIFTYCRQYEACSLGAGLDLIETIYSVLLAEFSDGNDVCVAEMHKESTQSTQAELNNAPKREKVKEHLETIAVHSRRVKELTREILTPEIAVAANGRQRSQYK